MQTAKPSIYFRHDNYDVEIDVLGERKLALTIIDSLTRAEFYASEVQLKSIGTNTVIKALERVKEEIKIDFTQKLISDELHLVIKVFVESTFLKPVQQVILLKKSREVSETEALKKSIDYLNKKIKDIKESNDKNKVSTFYGATLEQKSYSSSAYEALASLKLPKGKYLITFNFLLKATNQWIYLYFGQGGSLMQNQGFYVPTNTSFIPFTIRKVHTVSQNIQEVSFKTYCANSYPVIVRNAIITAKPISE